MGKRGILNIVQPKEVEKRPIRWRKYPHLFLIVCEDQNTEPLYFERFINFFPKETVFIRAVGTGRSSLGVVQQAIKEKRKLAYESGKIIDEVWTVFDKDDADKSPGNTTRFLDAFKLAKEEEFRVAYSNEAFELWLLLHFNNVNGDLPIPRSEIYSHLEKSIKRIHNHNNFRYIHGEPGILDIVFKNGNESLAIERAEFLHLKFKNVAPIVANPSTTMHILVKRLRELEDWHSESKN